MASALHDLLAPHLPPSTSPAADATAQHYLARLQTLPLAALSAEEPESLSAEALATLRALQSLSRRSYRSIDAAATSLSSLSETLPSITTTASSLQSAIPSLGHAATEFTSRYAAANAQPTLERRRRMLALSENLDRLSDVLELPSLLTSTIASAAGERAGSAHTQALDLHAHIRRLARLHPDSKLVAQVAAQADAAMSQLVANLMTSLRASNVKLAGGMRTISLLRRVAPELTDDADGEGSLGLLFLVSRLLHLNSQLEALVPLQELADQETKSRLAAKTPVSSAWAAGQQTERYLKRYIEVFREVAFAIVSVYRGIFVGETSGAGGSSGDAETLANNQSALSEVEQKLPPALSTFTLHIVQVLFDTLQTHLPNVRDRSSRDSLLTQVLYCAASLGRLGGDFGMMLALLEEDVEEEAAGTTSTTSAPEWISAMKKHRVQAGRLELLASSAGTKKTEVAAA